MKKLITVLAFAGLTFFGSDAAQGQGFVVVVNASNPATSVAKTELSNIMMKKATKWSHGADAAPVDNTSAVRDAFSQAVHGRGASAIQAHWQQQIFAGKDVPPPEKASDTAVLEFVRSTPGAVGYVSSGAALGAGVKTIQVN